ncbi:MAG: DUF4012 domain-containing protein [Actinomycetota bacterium]
MYTGLAGAALTLAGSRGRRYSWLATALVALWVAPGLELKALTVVGVAVALYALARQRRRWIGAMVGAVLAFVLARLGAGPFHGSTTLIAFVAAAPMAISALRRLPEGLAQAVSGVAGILASAATLATLVFGLAAIWSLGDVTDAIDASTEGFEFASDGEQDAAVAALDRAEASFESARSKVGGFWTFPARLVPVVGQHVRAVQVAASEGVSLTATAADAARAVDIDDIRVENGALDLGFLDELAPVLSRVDRAVVRADDRLTDAKNPWLLPPIADRLDQLTDELGDARPATETAAIAVRKLPELLGRSGPVHWLVLTVTPAEARGIGGLVGNYLVIEANGGRLEIVAAGRNEDLNRALAETGAELRAPDQYVDRWGAATPERFFQDVGLEPDLPSVGAVAADLYEQATGLSIEGVVTLDPYAIAAVLEVTGPVTVDELRLGSSNAAEFLLIDQYTRYADDETGRVAALSALVAAAFDAFTSGELPGPRVLADAIGPSVEEDRLGVWWKPGGSATDLIDIAGLDARFPTPDGGDLIGVVHQNAGQNKIDAYLERTLEYTVVVDDRGDASATAIARFTNTAPASGLPDSVIGSNDQGYQLGTNVALVHLHTGLDLVSVAVDGEPVPGSRRAAFGAEAIGVEIEIPAGSTVEIVYELAGRVDPDYRLQVVQQPLVGTEQVSVTATVDGQTRILLDGADLRTDRSVAFADAG